MKRLALFAAILWTAGNLFAETYTFSLLDYPKSVSGCLATSETIKEKLTDAGMQVTDIDCKLFEGKSYWFKVTYEASEKLEIIQVHQPARVFLSNGMYETMDECEGATLGKHVDMFQRETGLTAHLSYCSFDPLERNRPVGVNVVSWGSANNKPSRVAYSLHGRLLDQSIEDYAMKVTKIFKAKGHKVYFFDANTLVFSRYVNVASYGPQSLEADTEELGYFTSRDACKAASQHLASVIANHDLGAIAHCSEYLPAYPELGITLIGQRTIKQKRDDRDFETYEGCHGARTAMEAEYQEAGYQVKGSFCSMRGELGKDHYTATILVAK